jgi:hypothetical protein
MNTKDADNLGLDMNFKTIESAIEDLTKVAMAGIAPAPKGKEKQPATPEQVADLVSAVGDLVKVGLESFARLAYAQQRQADALEAIATALQAQVGIWPQPTKPAAPPAQKGKFKTVSKG